jgi:hypothetical protein
MDFSHKNSKGGLSQNNKSHRSKSGGKVEVSTFKLFPFP